MAKKAKEATVTVKLVRSLIGSKKDQIATVAALGLKKIRDEKIHEATPQIKGMIAKVCHLVSVEEI